MTSEISVTSELDSGDTVIFDAPYTEADDHDDTHLVYELFVDVLGA